MFDDNKSYRRKKSTDTLSAKNTLVEKMDCCVVTEAKGEKQRQTLATLVGTPYKDQAGLLVPSQLPNSWWQRFNKHRIDAAVQLCTVGSALCLRNQFEMTGSF